MKPHWAWPYPNWVGDHYEETNIEFARTLPDMGFYFWFHSQQEQCDDDAVLFMGNEL